MSGRLVYFNGEFIPEVEARISIFDCALMYGDMLFEMTRSFGQKSYRLREHLERLYASMKYAGIDCGMSIGEMEAATAETIERNLPVLEGYDFQIMHDVTRGALPLYDSLVKEGTAPIVSINVFPLVRHIGGMAEKYETGGHFVITPQRSVPARYIDPKAKNRSRIYYKIAELQAAHMEEGAMALLTDEHGFVTEGTGNNFFMVRDGEILTPKPHDILRGVSRGVCMALAGKLGIPMREADIEPYDVRGADEAWFTSTTICMIPITRFDFQQIGDGKPGPIYRRLLGAWSEEVGMDIAGQAREYAEKAKNWTP
ncbi:MAG: branched-chain amino acid aminotransferase [Gemmatimonadetes bacterium]|jgi:branched-chain amino acid aminotransferase|nr:branched-chain amino acid aminotransferase [Gemmatimonadota bacterium]